MGATSQPLPLGPLTALQFAICYINLAIPSTAARVAITVRFFQRCGIPSAPALSAGLIDSISGFVIQIGLFLVLFFASDADLAPSTDAAELSGLATLALLTLLAVVVAMVIAVTESNNVYALNAATGSIIWQRNVGTAVSSGCFRLVNSDVADLYERVPVGTKVIIRQKPEL